MVVFYWAFRVFLRLCFRIFYRRVEAPGLTSLPRTGPLLLVANHGNALIDPLLLLALVPRRIAFLAKHTLFPMPVVGFVLRRIGGLPVYRRQDAPVETSGNERTFETCRRILGEGGTVCIFPEGQSHHQPRLRPLRKGAARIFFRVGLEHRAALRIFPIGINFEDKGSFRSRVLVIFGGAVDTRDLVGIPDEASEARVPELTARIDEALGSLVPGVGSWEELRFVREIEQLYLGRQGDSLRGEAPVLKRFLEAYERLRREDPEAVLALRCRWEAYRRQRSRFGLTEAEMDLAEAPSRAARFLLMSLAVIFLVLPLAVVGFAVHYPPYRLCQWIERRFNRHPDQAATVKFLTGVALFPLIYLLVLAGPSLQGAWWLLFLLAALLPISGWAALMVAENRQRLRESARALALIGAGGRALREIGKERAGILAQVTELVRRETSPPLTGACNPEEGEE